MKPCCRSFLFYLGATIIISTAFLAAWILWGSDPCPKNQPIFSDADTIIVLGGGNPARHAKGVSIADAYPDLPLVVTGDGGVIVNYLTQHGIPAGRIIHEQAATSTVENARFTAPILDRMEARRVILVTNWFHVPRSLAVFRKYQPGRDFVVAFAPKPETMSKWDAYAVRRERLAAIHNLLVHGVWSW